MWKRVACIAFVAMNMLVGPDLLLWGLQAGGLMFHPAWPKGPSELFQPATFWMVGVTFLKISGAFLLLVCCLDVALTVIRAHMGQDRTSCSAS